MKTKCTMMVALAVITLFCSCTKDSDTDTNAAKIVGKWSVVSVVSNTFVNNTSHPETYNGTSSDFYNFAANGDFSYVSDGDSGIGTYSVNGSQITLSEVGYAFTATISTLTANSLVMYYKDGSASSYYESTITLKK